MHIQTTAGRCITAPVWVWFSQMAMLNRGGGPTEPRRQVLYAQMLQSRQTRLRHFEGSNESGDQEYSRDGLHKTHIIASFAWSKRGIPCKKILLNAHDG